MTQPAPRLRAARKADSVGFGLQGFFLAVLLTQLPQLRDHYDISPGLIVVYAVSISILAGAGSVLAERVAHRWSSGTTVRIGFAVVAASGVGIALSPGLATLFVAFACYGIGLGLVDASTNMQAVSIQHAYGRIILSSFYAVWSAGAITGALFVSVCSAADVSLRVSILIAAAVVALVTVAIGPRLLPTGHEATEHEKMAKLTPIPMRPFIALGSAMGLFFAIDIAVGNWSALYIKDVMLSDASTAALALAVYQGMSLVSRLTGDLWVRRFGELLVVRVACVIAVCGLVIVIAAQNSAMAIVGFLVVGCGAPIVAPLSFSAAGQLVPPEGLDGLIARLNIFSYVGTIAGAGLVGGIAAVANLRVGFVLPLLFAMILILLAPAFGDRSRSRQQTRSTSG